MKNGAHLRGKPEPIAPAGAAEDQRSKPPKDPTSWSPFKNEAFLDDRNVQCGGQRPKPGREADLINDTGAHSQ
jgi:hypothetical protein